jgi:hypothetical protein
LFLLLRECLTDYRTAFGIEDYAATVHKCVITMRLTTKYTWHHPHVLGLLLACCCTIAFNQLWTSTHTHREIGQLHCNSRPGFSINDTNLENLASALLLSPTHLQKISKCVAQGYTIVVSSYDRQDALAAAVLHWMHCPRVQEVQVVWHHPTSPFPDRVLKAAADAVDKAATAGVRLPNVKKRLYPENKLTNRFALPNKNEHLCYGFPTSAIFSVDDDEGIDCRMMTSAHELWCGLQAREPDIGTHAPYVGFEPRMFDIMSDTSARGGGMGYVWNESCGGTCMYNTLWVTKGAFLSAQQVAEFWRADLARLRDAVDTAVSGEDMLMSAVLMSAGALPVAIHASSKTPQERDAVPDLMKHLTLSLGHRSSSHRLMIRNALQQAFSSRLFQLPQNIWWFTSLDASKKIWPEVAPCQRMELRCTNG